MMFPLSYKGKEDDFVVHGRLRLSVEKETFGRSKKFEEKGNFSAGKTENSPQPPKLPLFSTVRPFAPWGKPNRPKRLQKRL
jgi:hypothetical protein